MSSARSLEGLVQSSQFGWGLLVGAGAAGLARVVAAASDRIPRPPRRAQPRWVSTGLLGAAVLLGGAGWFIGHRAGLPGWLALSAVVGLMAIGAPLVALFDCDFDDGRVTSMGLTLGAAGIWACIPDTELARGSVAAGLAATGLWSIGPRRRLGTVPVVLSCGGLAAVIASGARGRPAAAFGAVMCLSLLFVVPVIKRMLASSGRRLASIPLLAVFELVAVALSSRWVGLLRSNMNALGAAAVLLMVEVAATTMSSRGAPAGGLPGNSAGNPIRQRQPG